MFKVLNRHFKGIKKKFQSLSQGCYKFVTGLLHGCSNVVTGLLKGCYKAGNGINSPTSKPLIETLLLQNVYHFYQGVEN